MKIVKVDNFGRESVVDELIAENVKEYWGDYVVKLLNDKQHEDSQDYFKCVDDNYILWRGMEELV